MLSSRIKQWKTSFAAVGMTCMILGSTPNWAGDPVSASYCQENDKIFWFMTITDTHIGMRGSQDTNNLSWVVHEGKSVINPSFIVLSGDITDSTDGNLFGWPNGPHQSEWNEYRATLDMANTGINAGNFFDIPGNHDAYSDGDFNYYLANSVQGQATRRTQASWTYNLGTSKYHFLGTNTSANDGRSFSFFFPYGDNAGLDTDELTYIESELYKHSDSELTLVFGHHPIEDTGYRNDTWLFYGAPEFAALLEEYGASSYTYGHTHRFSEAFFTSYAITPGVFYININSLGESSDNHFNVTAIDCNGISMVTQAINRWPVVMITTPMDRNLGKNAHPLLGYTVPNGTGNPLRALLFHPDISGCTAEYRIDGAAVWQPMSNAEGNPNLWEAAWDTSALNEGEHTVEVRATGSEGTVRTDTISVYVDAGTIIPNEAPIADFGFSVNDLTVNFTDNSTDSDGRIVSWSWDFNDSSSSTSQNPSHTYTASGTYSVTLIVTDDDGAQNISAPITIEVTSVSNEVPEASFSAAPISGDIPLPVEVNAGASSDPDGTIDQYDWDFGDGTTAQGVTASYIYTVAGDFTITLTVTDNGGKTDSTTTVISAIDPGSLNAPTELTASVSGSTVDLSWTDNSDEDAFVVQRAKKTKGQYNFSDIGSTVNSTFSDTGLGSGTYQYRVYAKRGTDASDYSNIVTVRVK